MGAAIDPQDAMLRAMNPNRQLAAPNVWIVVVDDDEAVRDSLKFSLEIEGFAVRTYARPQLLLNEIEMPACDCLIVDQNMPGMTGLDLIESLRGRKMLAPAILITTHARPEVRSRAASSGVAIVEKPLLDSILMDNIRHITARPQPLPN